MPTVCTMFRELTAASVMVESTNLRKSAKQLQGNLGGKKQPWSSNRAIGIDEADVKHLVTAGNLNPEKPEAKMCLTLDDFLATYSRPQRDSVCPMAPFLNSH